MKSIIDRLALATSMAIAIFASGCSEKTYEPDNLTFQDGTSGNISTLDAKPLAFSAVLKGKISGSETPDEVGFELCYNPDFNEYQIGRVAIEGTKGTFEIEKRGLIDQIKVYYRAYAVYGEKTLYGETKTFTTAEGTYELNGKTYKFIKVQGGSVCSYSMMQTELIPDYELKIDGRKIGTLDADGDGFVTKGETRAFLSEAGGLMRPPTLDEWKFAARGGLKSKGYTYSGGDDINIVGWCKSNSEGSRRRPAQKKANELGFYDMSGNYAEFVCKYTEEDLLNIVDWTMAMPNSIKYVTAKFFNTSWASPVSCGGTWNSAAEDCKINSMMNDDWKNNHNKYPAGYYTFRLVYLRPD